MTNKGDGTIDPMDAFDAFIYDSYLATHANLSLEIDDQVPPSLRRSLLRYLRRFLPADRTAAIVDLGCGSGSLLAVAEELGYKNLHGVDRCVELVARARKRSSARVEVMDLKSYLAAAPEASIDTICAFDVLEHFRKPELLRLCREISRVLKPGGDFLLHVPNGGSDMGGYSLYGDITHQLAFTGSSLNQMLMPLGFEKVTVLEDEPVPSGLKSTIRLVLWRIIRVFIIFRSAVETGVMTGHILTANLFAATKKRAAS